MPFSASAFLLHLKRKLLRGNVLGQLSARVPCEIFVIVSFCHLCRASIRLTISDKMYSLVRVNNLSYFMWRVSSYYYWVKDISAGSISYQVWSQLSRSRNPLNCGTADERWGSRKDLGQPGSGSAFLVKSTWHSACSWKIYRDVAGLDMNEWENKENSQKLSTHNR